MTSASRKGELGEMLQPHSDLASGGLQIQPLALTWVRAMTHFHVLPSGLAILKVSPYLETRICMHHGPQADTGLAYFLQEFSNET